MRGRKEVAQGWMCTEACAKIKGAGPEIGRAETGLPSLAPETYPCHTSTTLQRCVVPARKQVDCPAPLSPYAQEIVAVLFVPDTDMRQTHPLQSSSGKWPPNDRTTQYPFGKWNAWSGRDRKYTTLAARQWHLDSWRSCGEELGNFLRCYVVRSTGEPSSPLVPGATPVPASISGPAPCAGCCRGFGTLRRSTGAGRCWV